MDDESEPQRGPKLLLEREAAEILRCSTGKIKRLRMAGELAYLPGGPVLIDRKDLDGYIQRKKQAAEALVAAKNLGRPKVSARSWALRAKITRRVKPQWPKRPGPPPGG